MLLLMLDRGRLHLLAEKNSRACDRGRYQREDKRRRQHTVCRVFGEVEEVGCSIGVLTGLQQCFNGATGAHI